MPATRETRCSPGPDDPRPPPAVPVLAAAELQDHLMVANNDLERLQRLLDDASQALMQHFTYASEHMDAALVHIEAQQAVEPPTFREARLTLATPSPRCSSRTWPRS
jgi:hypothetical protein